jgi:hypothetical protein
MRPQYPTNGRKRPSNGLPTPLPTVCRRPTNGVCSNPPYTPQALEAAFSGAFGPLVDSVRRSAGVDVKRTLPMAGGDDEVNALASAAPKARVSAGRPFDRPVTRPRTWSFVRSRTTVCSHTRGLAHLFE